MASIKTPSYIQRLGDSLSISSDEVGNLVRSSKTCAKVDNALVPDVYLSVSSPTRILRVLYLQPFL